MYGLVTKLLVSRQLKFEEGKIIVLEEPVCMLPLVYVKTATKLALMHHKKNKADKSLEEMYFESWTAGYEITKRMTEVYKLRKFEERYKVAMDIISLFGFGDYETLEFKAKKYAYFKVHKNPFAMKFHPGKIKMDIFLAGANAGGGTVVHEVLINCVELECAAINGSHCKFINCNTELLEKYVKSREAYDMDWKYIMKKEIEYIKNDKDMVKKIEIPKGI
jgi:predicted hydrocarbon binding protein